MFDGGRPTVAILKHTNPCGVGQAETLAEAYAKAFATDRQSPFGGIVVVNQPLDRATAEAIDAVFTEIIIAPSFEEGVLDFLMQKANRRLVRADLSASGTGPTVRTVAGGLLVQDRDATLAADVRDGWTVPTERQPSEREWADLDFAWRVCKHVKSNAIVYARPGQTVGVGAGQMSRVDAARIGASKALLPLKGTVVGSDAFFPFPDGVEEVARHGVTAVIQPGGSRRDQEVIDAANRLGLAMVFTGVRHFRH